jgi:hypothetical protein
MVDAVRTHALFTEWHVPTAPPTKGALIYMFPGVEHSPSDAVRILQPVLQFGHGAAGGGNYWSIASWAVAGGSALHTTLHGVASGSTIYGAMQASACVNGTCSHWAITVAGNGGTRTLSLAHNTVSYHWALAGVLEVYGAHSCSMFPGSGVTQFADLHVDTMGGAVTPPPNWTKYYWLGDTCAHRVSEVNRSAIDLWY